MLTYIFFVFIYLFLFIFSTALNLFVTPLALAGQLGGYSGRDGRYPGFPLDAHTAGTQTVACRFALGGHACKFLSTCVYSSTTARYI
jgi:hypothetical protein